MVLWGVLISSTSLEIEDDTIRYNRISGQREIFLHDVKLLSERIDTMSGGKYRGGYTACLLFSKKHGDCLLEIARYPQLFRKSDYVRFLKALKEADPKIQIDQNIIGRLDIEDAFGKPNSEPVDPRPFMSGQQ